jgi:hypothetical protein
MKLAENPARDWTVIVVLFPRKTVGFANNSPIRLDVLQ